MLYERWRTIAREFRSELALRDATTGQCFTFGQLDQSSERENENSSIAFPQGHSADFIITILRAWRKGQIVCPLEPNQPRANFDHLPPGCVHLKTTSATTGVARVIAFTAEQLAADAENIVATMSLRRDWPNLGVISLAHSYGFSNLVTPLLLHGIPLILAGPPLPEIIRKAAALVDAVTLPAVPALWRTWHAAESIPAQIRLAISAGAPLALELEREIFSSSGIKIHNFYGSSECGGIAYDDTSTPRTDAAGVGQPMRNVEVSVAGDGCLQIQSRAMAQTYWPEPDESLANGCFKTSDLAEIKDGTIFLRGRVSDQINIAGRKIAPEMIERVLSVHPQVRECLVFGLESNNEQRGETIVACVAVRSPLTTNVLRQFLLERLPAWQIPREWMFVESLGANGRGKVSRKEWSRKFLEAKAGTA